MARGMGEGGCTVVDVLAAEVRHDDGGVGCLRVCWLLVGRWSECCWLGWLLRDCLSGVRVVCRREEGLGKEERFYGRCSGRQAAVKSAEASSPEGAREEGAREDSVELVVKEEGTSSPHHGSRM